MLQPWQLIKLKAKYGGIYVTQFNGKLYVLRHPTLLEVTLLMDAKNVFKLSIEQMFYELAKLCMVYPEDPDEVPEGLLKKLAELMLDDIPLTEAELERKLIDIASVGDNLYKNIATELWYRISGTTIHEFYNQSIKQVLEMYSTIKLLSDMVQEMQKQQEKQLEEQIALLKQTILPNNVNIYNLQRAGNSGFNPFAPHDSSYDFEPDETHISTKQSVPIAKNILEVKQILNKPLDEVLKELLNKQKR